MNDANPIECTSFRLGRATYALRTEIVREILWLPELTALDEVPAYVAGALDLRGVLTPVIDLNCRLGHDTAPYRLADQLIVFEDASGLIGVIANEVLDVTRGRPLAPPASRNATAPPVVACELEIGDSVVALLEHNALWPRAGQVDPTDIGRGCGQGTDVDEAGEFRRRAVELMAAPPQASDEAARGFAIVRLAGEQFGVPLEDVAEFADVGDVAPIPCTPAHILGNANLRGDIVTVVRVHGLLQLDAKPPTSGSKLVVLDRDSQLVGVPIDTAPEVIYVEPDAIGEVSRALPAARAEFLLGEVACKDRMVPLLDLARLLDSEQFVVDESP